MNRSNLFFGLFTRPFNIRSVSPRSPSALKILNQTFTVHPSKQQRGLILTLTENRSMSRQGQRKDFIYRILRFIKHPFRTPYSVFLMHRRKDLWGPDGLLFLSLGNAILTWTEADEFDPDRFLDERLKKYLTPKPFIFLPFNAGPRICLGQQVMKTASHTHLLRLIN